ncbi:MAG: SufS family cysteine desulfurase [Actinophytocola sp.]|uniref:SufS family cysteine desulfurase n=1 Tax=Actinophytocola sp. TaxID=1872138 RepID=UPI003C756E95
MSTTTFAIDPAAVRADFAFFDDPPHRGTRLCRTYLDNAATAQRPRAVLAAVEDSMTRFNANVHRGIYALAAEATSRYEAARATVATFVGAAANEIVFTKNATEAINLAAQCLTHADPPLALRVGDSIVLSEMEHHSNIVPWRLAAQRSGAHVRYLGLDNDGRLETSQLTRVITADTKVVAVTHASNMLGTLNDLTDVIHRAREVGALVLVDASQTVPHQPVDVRTLGADLLVFTGHKMCGPTGIGVLWGRADLLNALPPFLGGGDMLAHLDAHEMVYAAPPHRFEAGTPPVAEVSGLAAAVDYLTATGMRRVRDHDRQLCGYAMQRLLSLPGVNILGPRENEDRGAVISFTVDGIDPVSLTRQLDRAGIAIRAGHHCAQLACARFGLTASARLSTYLYNTTDDVDALVDELITIRAKEAS